jgi:hypothetical protein
MMKITKIEADSYVYKLEDENGAWVEILVDGKSIGTFFNVYQIQHIEHKDGAILTFGSAQGMTFIPYKTPTHYTINEVCGGNGYYISLISAW